MNPSLPDPAVDLQSFCLAAVVDLLARTPRWQAAVAADGPAAARARIVLYGARKGDGLDRVELPPTPFAVVSAARDAAVALNDVGDGRGIGHDWTCGVLLLLVADADLRKPAGEDEENFQRFHGEVVFALRRQFKAAGPEAADNPDDRDYRIANWNFAELFEPKPGDPEPYWGALWKLDMIGTLG